MEVIHSALRECFAVQAYAALGLYVSSWGGNWRELADSNSATDIAVAVRFPIYSQGKGGERRTNSPIRIDSVQHAETLVNSHLLQKNISSVLHFQVFRGFFFAYSCWKLNKKN